MMLDLQSEEFAATGGMAGEGARRLLGRPKLSPLEVMIREALQNSWDARSPDTDEVRFCLDVWRLNAQQRRALETQVFASVPPEGLTLGDFLLAGDLDVVVVSDRGTVGLAGPTRTDVDTDEGAPDNFVQFFRNVGRLRTGPAGGGTYGFGKASFYTVSQASTIIGYTRVRDGRSVKSRLMAAALGRQYRGSGRARAKRYTGRHWWGVREDHVVEPVTGAAADRIAVALGFRPFADGETGTSVMVIAPRLPGADAEASRRTAARAMCRAAVWYGWPLMLDDRPEGHPRLVVEGTFDGAAVSVPEVDQDPLLKEYARAFRYALRARDSRRADPLSRLTMYELECQRPAVPLGRLVLARVFSNVAPEWGTSDTEDDLPESSSAPSGPPAHVALLRGPRLVVRYLRARVPAGVGFVGVFVANNELNGVFAEAEPATHDDWNSESLEDKRSRTLVRVTRRRIEETVEEFVRPESHGDEETTNLPLGGIARLLGTLIPDSAGPGAEVQSGRTGRNGTGGAGVESGRPRVEMLPDVVLLREAGRKIARFPFRIRGGAGAVWSLTATISVVTADGGREADAPVGAAQPGVHSWACGDRRLADEGNEVEVEVDPYAIYALYVTVPENTAVAAGISIGDGEHQ